MQRSAAILGASLLLVWAGCGTAGEMSDAAPAPPTPPEGPAPTGSKWEGVDDVDGCGRRTRRWILVDDLCGGRDRSDYFRSLAATIYRDGALRGDTLWSVDGSHLWGIDVSQPSAPQRRALVAGWGQPLGVEIFGDRLLVAAGEAGLLSGVFGAAGELGAPVAMDLGAPVLGLTLDGDRAWAALGASGVAVVDLRPGGGVLQRIAVPGFAVSTAVEGDTAVVAACESVSVFDRESGRRRGSLPFEFASRDGRNLSPARDVALKGDVAFVAAGTWGTVGVDLSEPEMPRVLGACSNPDPLYYSSGLRIAGDTLVIAAGEWGVDRRDASLPRQTCVGFGQTPSDPSPPLAGSCSDQAPWEGLDWSVSGRRRPDRHPRSAAIRCRS